MLPLVFPHSVISVGAPTALKVTAPASKPSVIAAGPASFAQLVYVSAWLKCHYPAAFTAALINSQPMGFYAPAQLVRDAREHGVVVRPVDVNCSLWDSVLECCQDSDEDKEKEDLE